MYCNNCGTELLENANYCQKCGRAVMTGHVGPRPPLERPREGRKVAGVCLGVARHLDIDVTLMRILWVLTAFLGLGGVVAYIVAWVIMPEEPLAITAPLASVVANPPHAVGQ
jgi:phage shock protein C